MYSKFAKAIDRFCQDEVFELTYYIETLLVAKVPARDKPKRFVNDLIRVVQAATK